LLCPSILNAKRGIQILKEYFMNEEYGHMNITLNPNNGGLEQLVTNFNRDLFCSSSKPPTTC
jgi:hypothetical protein